MKLSNLVSRILTLIVIITSTKSYGGKGSTFKFRIRECRCECSKKSISDHFCQLKTFRRQSYYNLTLNLTRRLVNVKVDFALDKKQSSSDVFETIFKVPSIQFCKIVSNDSFIQIIPAIKDAVEFMMKYGNTRDYCTGASNYIKMLNVTWDDLTYLRILPRGEYKFHFTWSDDLDERIFYNRLYGNIITWHVIAMNNEEKLTLISDYSKSNSNISKPCWSDSRRKCYFFHRIEYENIFGYFNYSYTLAFLSFF